MVIALWGGYLVIRSPRVPSVAGADAAPAAANGDAERASPAASEPESGEIEGEVGNGAEASAPVENGVKPDKERSTYDHKRCTELQ
jgi:hypothetical protein